MFSVSWIHRYSDHAASSRLRVFAIHKAISNNSELGSRCRSQLGYQSHSDVVVIQKAVDPAVFKIVDSNKHKLVVYDCDDIIGQTPIILANEIAHIFTVDTQGHKELLESIGITKPVYVIDDPIDYDCDHPMTPVEANNSAVWFGNRKNETGVLWMLDTLLSSGVRSGIISDIPELPDWRLQSTEWKYETFPQDLRKYGTCVLSHRGADLGKSINKLIASVTLGVPVISDACGSYPAFLKDCGLEQFIASNPFELADAFEKLEEPSIRKNYFENCQDLIWQRFNTLTAAKRFVNLFEANL